MLTAHNVETAYERDWSTLRNGELLAAAEQEGFEVFVTTDSNLKYQQNLETRNIAIIVLSTTSWPRISEVADRVASTVDQVEIGTYTELSIP